MQKTLVQFPYLRSFVTEALIIKKKMPTNKTRTLQNILLLLTWSFLLFYEEPPSPTPSGYKNKHALPLQCSPLNKPPLHLTMIDLRYPPAQ